MFTNGKLTKLILDLAKVLPETEKPDHVIQSYFQLDFTHEVRQGRPPRSLELCKLQVEKGVDQFLDRAEPNLFIMDCDTNIDTVTSFEYREHSIVRMKEGLVLFVIVWRNHDRKSLYFRIS